MEKLPLKLCAFAQVYSSKIEEAAELSVLFPQHHLFVSKLSSPLSSLARVIPILQNHRIDFVRFKNIYQLQKESQSKEIGILISNYKKLEIEPIYMTIEKYKPLNFPELVFESGKINCLKGVSGIGKTTLLKLIS